ncbi:MAG TPA: GIY-YIG nuclease family protein [Chitinophagaceae bacterium]|nr:GIY-YIG nuclease family protein [Chitinophagaceae bacterium]
MFIVYILFSESTQKCYTGQTQNLENRLLEHNSGETPSIKHGIPWKLVWFAQVESRKEAMILEKKIKNKGAMRFIESKQN